MQRYALIADLASYYADIGSVDPVIVQAYLDGAAALIGLDAFRLRSMIAHAHLTLHFLSLAGLVTGGTSGPVTSRRVRDLATTYASFVMPTPSEFAETRWGRIYLTFERATPTIGIAVCGW